MIEFFSAAARDRDNLSAASQRIVNMYREPAPDGSWLKSVLGMADFSAAEGATIRAMETVRGELYVASSERLWRIGEGGYAAFRGFIADSRDTGISGNNGKIAVVAGGRYFVLSGQTMTEPEAGAFDKFGSVTFLANYTITSKRNGNLIQWSDLGNASSLPGLNFASADGRDDDIVRVMALSGTLWVFKENSREAWYSTGQAGPDAFLRMAGGIYDIGLAGYSLIAPMTGAAFLIGSDGRAHIQSGGQLQPVSIPAVETAIKTQRPRDCFTYDDEGHTFCVVTFRDGPAWVYDISTGEWHERAEGVGLGPWSATCSAYAYGSWIVGRHGGKLSKLARTNTDDGGPLAREVTGRTLRADGQRFIVHEFEPMIRQGFSAGNIVLTVSRDAGVTWGAEKLREVGPVGKYGRIVNWRGLGQFRQFTPRLRCTDPAEINIGSGARVRT